MKLKNSHERHWKGHNIKKKTSHVHNWINIIKVFMLPKVINKFNTVLLNTNDILHRTGKKHPSLIHPSKNGWNQKGKRKQKKHRCEENGPLTLLVEAGIRAAYGNSMVIHYKK